MSKKNIIIYSSLALLVIVTIVLYFTVNKKDDLVTCTYSSGSTYQEWNFDIKNDLISKLNIKVNKSSLTYNYETLNNLTSSQKNQIQEEVLYDLGLDRLNYDGIDIKLNYNEYLTIEIDIDYSKAQEDILKKLNLNYDKKTKFSSIKSQLESDNLVTCK